MILIASDMQDNPKEISDFFVNKGLEVYTVYLGRFKEELGGKNIDLIIYNTYDLHHDDIENIHLAKGMGIPLILITAYPEKWARDKICELWKYNFIKDYLIRPINLERLTNRLSICKGG